MGLRKKKKGGLFFGITSRTLMIIAAVLLGISYLSIFVNPAKLWWMTIFGLLFMPLALLNIFLVVWAIFRRSRAVWIPLAALLPSVFVAGWYFQSRGPEPQEPSADDVKIVSYNVGRFNSAAGGLTPQQCADSIVRLLGSTDADIISLQEFRMDNVADAKKWFSRKFKGYYVDYYLYTRRNGCFGNVILSRFPFENKGKLEFENSTNLALYGDCNIHGRKLRIYNCHFQSYSLSLPNLIKGMRKDYREAVKYTEEKIKYSVPMRARQVDQVMEHIDDCPIESIVTGDFNENPLSYAYWRLRKGRKDSFCEAGVGFGATFYALRPFLRIDYVLYPESLAATRHEVLHKRFSDHFPVVANISICGNQ